MTDKPEAKKASPLNDYWAATPEKREELLRAMASTGAVVGSGGGIGGSGVMNGATFENLINSELLEIPMFDGGITYRAEHYRWYGELTPENRVLFDDFKSRLNTVGMIKDFYALSEQARLDRIRQLGTKTRAAVGAIDSIKEVLDKTATEIEKSTQAARDRRAEQRNKPPRNKFTKFCTRVFLGR
ncbi:MAG: hypothetical protein ABII24_03070 [bacterium]